MNFFVLSSCCNLKIFQPVLQVTNFSFCSCRPEHLACGFSKFAIFCACLAIWILWSCIFLNIHFACSFCCLQQWSEFKFKNWAKFQRKARLWNQVFERFVSAAAEETWSIDVHTFLYSIDSWLFARINVTAIAFLSFSVVLSGLHFIIRLKEYL